jgi:hypothetical protein
LSARYRGCPSDVAREWHGRRGRRGCSHLEAGSPARVMSELDQGHRSPRCQAVRNDAAAEGRWTLNLYKPLRVVRPIAPSTPAALAIRVAGVRVRAFCEIDGPSLQDGRSVAGLSLYLSRGAMTEEGRSFSSIQKLLGSRCPLRFTLHARPRLQLVNVGHLVLLTTFSSDHYDPLLRCHSGLDSNLRTA